MFKYNLVSLILLNFLLVSCDNGLEGNLKENLPPNTSLTVNEINLPEGERLNSQVDISWWGDDPDGYVVGYEYYIGDVSLASEGEWILTEKTDSTFILPIPEGNMNADVIFNIRAVDNDNARDTEPANVSFPIRNTEPEIEFNFNETPPDTTYRIASFGFNATDPDGVANLNKIEVALNDTSSENSWVEIPLEANLVTLRFNDSIAEPSAEILLGRSATSSGFSFDSVNIEGNNQLFVKVTDNAAAESDIQSYSWYVKKQTSKVLFINDYNDSFGSSSQERAALHLNLLNSVGISEVDYLNISDGEVSGGTRVSLSDALPDRTLADPTINMMLAEWNYIYWISNDLNRNIGYALELTTDFFDQGGKMFINIPIEYLSDRNSLFQFLPFQGIQREPSRPGRSPAFQIQRCTEITASDDLDYSPYLRLNNRTIFPANPIIPFSESLPLFEADFTLFLRDPIEMEDYEGLNLISTMSPDESMIYFGIDLGEFTREESNRCEDSETGVTLPPSDLEGLIEFITIETLGFEQ